MRLHVNVEEDATNSKQLAAFCDGLLFIALQNVLNFNDLSFALAFGCSLSVFVWTYCINIQLLVPYESVAVVGGRLAPVRQAKPSPVQSAGLEQNSPQGLLDWPNWPQSRL